ncbi:phage tail protein [Poseidonocella sp. HB161398]|uniref:phage tail protein n=1 Tax=Poseidonocella sp. HB161398 TaxID=2320855 RepID=UPI0011087782|nr:phage tail protein [Poseidonocella sp. HB161398]
MARDVPYSNFNFKVVDQSGNLVGQFSDVSGLGAEVTVAEYRNGTDKQNHVTKIPGVHKFENVTLKRGIVDSESLFNWMKETWTSGPAAKRDIRIELQNEQHEPVQSWKLTGAWPTKYTGPTMAAAGGTEVAMEEIQLAYDVMDPIQEAKSG